MRKKGFYWVKLHGEWTVGEFNHTPLPGYQWMVVGNDEWYKESDFDQIIETPLAPPEV